MPGSECDHSNNVVEIYSDVIADVASAVDWGVLVEYSQEGIGVYLEGIDEDCATQLLQRTLDFLQGS